jgi:hypothetical protein
LIAISRDRGGLRSIEKIGSRAIWHQENSLLLRAIKRSAMPSHGFEPFLPALLEGVTGKPISLLWLDQQNDAELQTEIA